MSCRSGAGERREPVPRPDDRAGDAVRRLEVALERPAGPRSDLPRPAEPRRTSRREGQRCSPQSSRDVLLLVSAAGRLTVAQLQGIVEEARLRSALEAAADADVATVGAGSVVAFTHPLLASAMYDAAAPAERRRAHRVLADKLEDPVERARHRVEVDHRPRRNGRRGAGTGRRNLPEPWRPAVGRRAAGRSRTGHAVRCGHGRRLRSLAPRRGHLHRRRRPPCRRRQPWTRGRRWPSTREQQAQVLVRRLGWPTTSRGCSVPRRAGVPDGAAGQRGPRGDPADLSERSPHGGSRAGSRCG